MSSFYYCHDCNRDVDLKIESISALKGINKICKECGGTNWEVQND